MPWTSDEQEREQSSPQSSGQLVLHFHASRIAHRACEPQQSNAGIPTDARTEWKVGATDKCFMGKS